MIHIVACLCETEFSDATAEHVAPASAVLDFGLLTDAIHVGPDAHLEFQRLHVPNSGNRKLKHPTQRTRLHVAGAFALWPSVTLAKGSQVCLDRGLFWQWKRYHRSCTCVERHCLDWLRILSFCRAQEGLANYKRPPQGKMYIKRGTEGILIVPCR